MSDIIDDGFSFAAENPLLQIESRKKFVIYSLIAVLVFRLFLFLAEYIQYGNIEKYFEGDNSVIDSLESMDFFIIAFALLFVLAFIVTVVAVCMWIYRANQNIHFGGLSNIEYSSGWSVGWFFVPFANLVKPAYVMGEIDRGTNKLSGDFNGEAWKKQENNSVVVMWWLFYILSGIFTNISEKMIDENNMDLNNYSVISGLELMSFVFSVISAIMLYKLVTNISGKQEKMRTHESVNLLDN